MHEMKINGVEVKELHFIPDERGKLMEIFRSDDSFFEKFGQAYVTTVFPGVVKAWHYHEKQSDNFACISGTVKIALYDSRKDSPTHGAVMEIFAGEYSPRLVHVPPFVYHGFKGVGSSESMVLNVPTEVFDRVEPDEFRVDPHDNNIPYVWTAKDG